MKHYPLFTKGDIDGFFGLMIDNLIQLILIGTLCTGLLGMPNELLFGRILPGAAISIIFGNLFYSWQAHKLAKKTRRSDITALPYGINTVSLFAYILFIMLPVYKETKDPNLAWQLGLAACFLSGVIEFSGAFIATKIRQYTPRAALLSALAGIAITFIAMDFTLKTFQNPIIALLPLGIILLHYFSHIRFPLGIPGGLVAIIIGTALAWLTGHMQPIETSVHLSLPKPSIIQLFQTLINPSIWRYLSIIIPMGIFNVIGSLQNLESAEAAGDKYNNFSSLAVNGIGSMIASFFGSTFPTTIYIGHPGWKKMGAGAGYSVLNGIFITTICLTGLSSLILNIIPLEAGMGILLWIGIIIIVQAFGEVPKQHMPAVAIGLFPALAAWGLLLIENSLRAAGISIYELQQTLSITGMISLERGFIFTSIILSSISVFLIEKQFIKSSLWALIGCALSYIGIIHAYKLTPHGILYNFTLYAAPQFVLSYLLLGILFYIFHLYSKHLK